MDINEVHSVCDECATTAGFVPKDKMVGVWMDKCDICGRHRPCTDLWHDWKKKSSKKEVLNEHS